MPAKKIENREAIKVGVCGSVSKVSADKIKFYAKSQNMVVGNLVGEIIEEFVKGLPALGAYKDDRQESLELK